ncbi:hypothetical protein BCV72DRAFT_252780 [Rhizopus microsporus var. microsporus]|uniref:CXXC-type zinc finger protein 1 n=2 Tax=Rhizopus microsporus TaxID=58291 RepID=A0A1X0QQ94_RHIZD|nr:hypothetical protein BCV72DRAFT_252780 [Rhizopus microsporus var. microsporus]
MSSFPPIAIENNDEGLLRPLDPNNTTKHLPLRKRMAPILKWQPVETPEEHNRQYPHITPYPDLDNDNNNSNNNNKRTREETVVNNNEQMVKKVKRGRPPTKHLIKPTVNNNNNNNDTADTKQTRALPEENIVHCICKRPYTETEFMIACDNCNQWFHGECIGLPESQGLFVDLFFCENCSKTRTRIEQAEMKNPLSRGKLSSFADMDDRARLSRVKEERQHAKSMIKLCQHKLRFLELLADKHNEECCGFDSRLSWPDTIWEKVESIDEHDLMLLNSQSERVTQKPFSSCSLKKCTKHINWQKLKLAEIEQEKSEQFVILSMLERERQQIKARMKKRREDIDLIEFLENSTIIHS